MTRNYEVKINADKEVYSYGITDKEINHFVDGLVFLSMDWNEYNTMIIEDVLVKVFPYWDIYNNIIINISLD